MVTPDDKTSPWISIHMQATKAMTGLAAKLRLGPAARAPKQSKKEPAPVSYYEKMALLEERDDQ